MGRHQFKIAAVGDGCIDLYDRTGAAYPGGNPVNVAVDTVRLGGWASYIGAVGDDAYGELMRKVLEGEGVDVSHLHTLPGRTAVSHVTVTEGERVFGAYEEGVMTQFRLTEEDKEFLCAHDLLVSGFWGRIEANLPELKERGMSIAFDFADKESDPILEKVLPYVDYAFFARDGKTEGELESLLRETVARGAKIAVVTRGAKGSMAFDGETLCRRDAEACPVVDTMGAGDSFAAGFLLALLAGRPLQECMDCGARSSSQTIQHQGAW